MMFIMCFLNVGLGILVKFLRMIDWINSGESLIEKCMYSFTDTEKVLSSKMSH